ncbi:cobaltochelatase subunit CobN [Ectothiorhodospiraceae bacterium WFHF3C12]|nr:cobaltochelatase subunit CobN [Ectothiorhodospiraceae bacterium WFHF3C12]
MNTDGHGLNRSRPGTAPTSAQRTCRSAARRDQAHCKCRAGSRLAPLLQVPRIAYRGGPWPRTRHQPRPQNRTSVFICVHLWLILCLFPIAAAAETLFGIVSERSAAEAAAGAATFDQRVPGHDIVLRTPEQVAAMDDAELRAYWQGADAILLGAVFGDGVVPRLRRLARTTPVAADVPLLATNSDRQLLRLSQLDGRRVLADATKADLDKLTSNPDTETGPEAHRRRLAQHYPEQAAWLEGHAYWNGRGSENMARLMAWLLDRTAAEVAVRPPRPQAPLRYYRNGRVVVADALNLTADKPAVAILDRNTGDRIGDRALLDRLCAGFEERDIQCFAMLARWGRASVTALESLEARVAPARMGAVISLQGFVVGGGEGREAATEALKALNVPVLKGIRLNDRTEGEWRLSNDGIPADGVHYRVAMPEFQGIGQPLVLAASEPPRVDALTGIRLAVTRPIDGQVRRIVNRTANWIALQEKPNADKKLAIVYYNHPPGRHNVGADNLDVPASLWEILHRLKAAGYHTGELPDSPEALLERIQDQGVNLPENGKALRAMAPKIEKMPAADYRQWFRALPESIQAEVSEGPAGYLVARVRRAIQLGRPALGREILHAVAGDLRHLLEETRNEAGPRAADLVQQLEAALEKALTGEPDWAHIDRLAEAIRETGVPGLVGWGEAPGWVMTHNDELLLPGMRFGNIFIGPQPPRGWGVDEELLHANTAFPPPHQYLAFYHFLQDEFAADAIVHLGRHSTYEFLPRRRVGLTGTDYPTIIAGDLPGVYPYIVDGVGEGLQAKRRGLAVIVDHLTPPLKTTPLYDELLQLRQLVESFEAAHGHGGDGTPAQQRAMQRIREKLKTLELEQELANEIAAEHGKEKVALDQVDDELLVHEVGHYLTELQEAFMPEGLHVFGRDWSEAAVDTMIESMAGDGGPEPGWRDKLAASPAEEGKRFLAALDGRFVVPGKGNDPIRNPEVLPTGRNFHGLNGNLLPTRVGFDLGAELAAKARGKDPGGEGSEAVVLWASDTVRDEGAMVAFGLDMLGIRPVWNSRGIVEGIERLPLAEDRVRRDVVFTTSGLFRDLYGNLLVWLDKAVRLALQGSAETIRRDYPALEPALTAALEPVAGMAEPGNEPLSANRVAEHWVADARAALNGTAKPARAGEQAIYRVFGDAPGSYGAGINRLAERSGSWTDRDQLAGTYLHRMGHAYGASAGGEPVHDSFRARLSHVRRTYLGRASNLYGLMDNNDAFDYLGGLSMAVEHVAGSTPENRVIDHSDPGDTRVQRLETALLQELRGRYLNPEWIEPLMDHGYAGARTMGSEFMEYLWGWQVTNPEIIRGWAWEAVKQVYIDDRHELGLDEFLAEGQKAHVKSNMLAIMLVAVQKGFWEADPATVKDLARQFAELVAENGLPGSGHTSPDHPMLEWVQPKLPAELRQALHRAIADAGGAAKRPESQGPSTVTEVQQKPQANEQRQSEAQQDKGGQSKPRERRSGAETGTRTVYSYLGAALIIILAGGMIAGTRGGRQ